MSDPFDPPGAEPRDPAEAPSLSAPPHMPPPRMRS